MKKGKRIALIIIGAILAILLAIVITLIVLMHGYTIDSKYFDITTTKVDNDCITYKFTPKDSKEYDLYVYGDDSYHEGKVVYASNNSYVTNNSNSFSIRYDPNIATKQKTTNEDWIKKRITKERPAEITIYKTNFNDKENYLHMKVYFNEWISNGTNTTSEDPNSYHEGSVQPNRLAF